MSQLSLYIGTQTNAPHAGAQSEGIYRALLDTTSGQLSDLKLVGPVKSPTFLAIGPDSRRLYAVCDVDGSAISAWEVGDDGGLRFLNHQPSGGDGACHLSVDGSGQNVLVANYRGGNVASLPILLDGRLGAARSVVQHQGSGPNAARQEKPHAHSIYGDETNRFVYACDLGTDEVLIYRFDAATGTLLPAEMRAARVVAGGGPRHLALDPRGFAYVNNELGLSVTVFARDLKSGALTPLQTVPTLPQDAATEGVSTAEIALHPNGKSLYVSNRGQESVAVFEVEADGLLRAIQHVDVPAEPRGFGLSRDGRWLVVGGQKGHQIAVYAIEESRGRLAPRGQNLEISAPVCVVFASESID